MATTTKTQQAVILSHRCSFHTVRQIQEWDSRTVGIVRHRAGEYVVQYDSVNDHWFELSGIYRSDLRQEVL